MSWESVFSGLLKAKFGAAIGATVGGILLGPGGAVIGAKIGALYATGNPLGVIGIDAPVDGIECGTPDIRAQTIFPTDISANDPSIHFADDIQGNPDDRGIHGGSPSNIQGNPTDGGIHGGRPTNIQGGPA